MKTRSHRTFSRQSLYNKDNTSSSKGKKVEALGMPKKRQKVQNYLPPTVKKNPYDLIPFVPVIELSIKDMKGSPLPLLARLQKQQARFGAVKLVCPLEWQPTMEFKRPKLNLTTRIQPLHLLKLGKPFEEKKEAYTLDNFYEFANDFQRNYRMKYGGYGKTKHSQLQNQYWRLVEASEVDTKDGCTKRYRVTVQYAADLPANKYGSGFQTTSNSRSKDLNFDYADNYYNLNNIFHAKGSLLTITQQRGQYIGGITVPWLYVGMMFSSFCWHVEDSGINSINYNHFGSAKIWYVVPQSDKQRFDAYVEDRYGNKQVLNKITYMIDPLDLIRNGIKVYKVHQKPREFVCTFFKAYHCGLSEGYNIGEAVNFIIPESIPYIKQSIKASSKPSVFCWEWLIYQNFINKQKLGDVSQTLRKEYDLILQAQQKSLISFWERVKQHKVNYIQDKVRFTKHVCSNCKNYLFLSFTSCSSCKKDYCLTHTDNCCKGSHFCLSLRVPNQDRKVYISKLLKQ